MGKKYEINPEHVEKYVSFQKQRLAKYQREASKLNGHIDRIQYKIDHPEKELRRDLHEGVASVSKACGIPLAGKVKAVAEAVPGPVVIDQPAPKKEKKSEWEEWG